MRILIVSDAWLPQVNGVVRTLGAVKGELERLGHEVEIVGPDRFRTVALPGYPEIRVAVGAGPRLRAMMTGSRPDAIHIATEGPLGLAARRHCLEQGLPFTTAYHTRFPEYVRDRLPVPLALSYAVLRRFHAPSTAVMVPTESIGNDLRARGFGNIRRWSRGVDTELFRPRGERLFDVPRPVSLYVGRLAVEKNLDAFLGLDLPGTKIVVGGGPRLAELRRRYPSARFIGTCHGEDLARCYASADVFVFPSRTDTFGLVLLEALASGVPVAAYPAPGPLDVLAGSGAGCLDEDLGRAVHAALAIPAERCREHALRFSWRASAEQFLGHLHPFR
jgi:glycosyltransferase involved in cell wall biosynthesis